MTNKKLGLGFNNLGFTTLFYIFWKVTSIIRKRNKNLIQECYKLQTALDTIKPREDELQKALDILKRYRGHSMSGMSYTVYSQDGKINRESAATPNRLIELIEKHKKKEIEILSL